MTFYTDIFTKLGQIAGDSNEAMRWQNAMGDQYLDNIASLFTTDEIEQYMPNIYNDFAGQASTLSGIQSIFQNYVNYVLYSQNAAINPASNSTTDLINALILKMKSGSQTIQSNLVGTPTVGAISGSGTGSLLADNKNLDGTVNERIINESIKFVCTKDIINSNATQWSIVGYPNYGANSYRLRGNGTSLISDTRSNTLIGNGDFESWSTVTPASWTVNAGATLLASNASAYRGSLAAKITSDATVTTCSISQPISLVEGQRYCLTVRLKRTAAISGTSNLKVFVTNADTSNTWSAFNTNPTTLSTGYLLYNIFFNLPYSPVVTSNVWTVNVILSAANTITSTQGVYIDDIFVNPVTVFGGVNYILVPGATEFATSDNFIVTTDNNYGGVFQTFFGRYFGQQLPSSFSPTISDSLAAETAPVAGSGW